MLTLKNFRTKFLNNLSRSWPAEGKYTRSASQSAFITAFLEISYSSKIIEIVSLEWLGD